MRTTFRRIAVAALAGVIAFSAIGLSPAEARRWHRGDAAVLGAVAGIFGTIAVLAARDRYRDNYYGCYGCAPYGYYYQQPYGYAPGYGYHRWHHHWR
jgi:hypothetical protein